MCYKTAQGFSRICFAKALSSFVFFNSLLGEMMRNKRNAGLYAGGIVVTEKECKDYLEFVKNVVSKTKTIINGK